MQSVILHDRGARHVGSWPELPIETRLAIVVSSTTRDGWDQDTATIVNRDNSEVRVLEKKNEISFNQLITPEWAAHAIRAEQVIRSTVGPKLQATHERLTAAILNRFNQRSELLKAFAEEKPVSSKLKQSRAAVKAMLDDARKKQGR
ncbi:MAG: hypothetical protein EXQ47_00155 [Bryobacterales bacterium]|nr:hypothetical protein [Bryobacterales bacterium]